MYFWQFLALFFWISFSFLERWTRYVERLLIPPLLLLVWLGRDFQSAGRQSVLLGGRGVFALPLFRKVAMRLHPWPSYLPGGAILLAGPRPGGCAGSLAVVPAPRAAPSRPFAPPASLPRASPSPEFCPCSAGRKAGSEGEPKLGEKAALSVSGKPGMAIEAPPVFEGVGLHSPRGKFLSARSAASLARAPPAALPEPLGFACWMRPILTTAMPGTSDGCAGWLRRRQGWGTLRGCLPGAPSAFPRGPFSFSIPEMGKDLARTALAGLL